MATGLNNGVYKSSNITPPPGPNYSLSAYNGADPIVSLDTAGTANGNNVVGVLFDNASTYYTLSAVTLTSPDGDDTEIRSALPIGATIYTIDNKGFTVKYTLAETTSAPTLSGANLAVGPNHRRKRLLGYI